MLQERPITNPQPKPAPLVSAPAAVYCPICTHTVPAEVLSRGKQIWVRPDQKCPRCAASLAAGKVLALTRAA
jgi:hypothetical protein